MAFKKSLFIIVISIQGLIIEGFSMQVNNPFFSFNTGIKSGGYDTFDNQAGLLKKLGYQGAEKSGIDGFVEMQAAFDKKGLEIFTVYLKIDLDNEEQPYDPRMEDLFKQIEGKPTMPWFHIMSNKYQSSSSENDGIAVGILQELADKASKYNVRIMVYPHLNMWLENVQDAIRVCGKVNRPNVGMTFNLCHFLAYSHREGVDPNLELPELSRNSMPFLFAISLNGADAAPDNPDNIWGSFIQPLGEGGYDTFTFLKTFLDQGFEGPVGLQTYGIKQRSDDHLQKSIKTWSHFESRYKAKK